MNLEDYNCVLCTDSSNDETSVHLFIACPFAQACWASLGLHANTDDDPFSVISSFKVQLHLSFAMEIIISMS